MRDTSVSESCFHCGQPVPAGAAWHARIDGFDRPMCCPGCAAVAESIVGSGYGDYYSTRDGFAARAGAPGPAPDLADEGGIDCAFSVDGVRCAACVWLIERRLARLDGVLAADLNMASGRLQLRRDPARCSSGQVQQALREIGYGAIPYDPTRHGEQLERARKTLFRRLFVAGLSMMQVMMYALPVYLAEGDASMDADMLALMQWAALLLTVPAVLYSAWPFFIGAWRGLRAGIPGMDLPVAIGIGAAFGASVAATVRGQGAVWFDSVTMFIFLLLASRYFELSARRKAAAALSTLQQRLPATALRMPLWPSSRATEQVAASALAAGDLVLVGPGEAVPADAVVVEGGTEADLSLLTGESLPRRRGVGEALPGGAVNAGQPVLLRVTRAVADSTLAMLVRLAEQAGQGKPALALWADQVARWFVLALLLLAALVFIAWQLHEPARAWEVAVAVLVVSCPCALSLATPSALAAATENLLRRGVLVVRPHTLETLERATHVIFDKTGTLTEGRPQLRATTPLAGVDAVRCLHLAAALEAGSFHPYGKAIREACLLAPLAVTGLRHVNGQGVEGEIDGVMYRLGSAAFTGAAAHGLNGASQVMLSGGGVPLARFELADALRPDAAQVVAALQKRGKQVVLLSGDQQALAAQVGAQLGIAQVLGDRLPADKLAYVQQLQARGAVVAMVGDGVNDAAVLGAADVSFAMGSGSALAQLHADAVLLSGRLSGLADAAEGARRTLRVVRQNLLWASAYNALAIPAAAFGLLNPWMAGVGMSLSSALVVANALRLRRMEA
jgi:Cu2+-exporting ATPase